MARATKRHSDAVVTVGSPRSASPTAWARDRLLIGFAAVWLLFEITARLTGSSHGQAGLVVGAVVLAGLVVVERRAFGRSTAAALSALGCGRPARRGLLTALVLCVALCAFFPVFAWATGTAMSLRPDWWRLAPGLFAQAGIAEEALFRGYLYGHLREQRSFWRAAFAALPPFVAVHLLLFTEMPAPVALSATLLSVSLSFPLARLFDLGGRTIWAPAALHFVVQAGAKVVVAPEAVQMSLSLGWMALSFLLPWVVLVVPTDDARRADGPSVKA